MWLVCERFADRIPTETFLCSAPISREIGEKRKSVRVKNTQGCICHQDQHIIKLILVYNFHLPLFSARIIINSVLVLDESESLCISDKVTLLLLSRIGMKLYPFRVAISK